MNSFQLVGYMRDKPEELIFNKHAVIAFNLTQDNGKTNLPIYCTKPSLIGYVKDKCTTGCEMEIQGRMATQRYIKDAIVYNRIYLIAEKIKRTNLPKVKFAKNVIMSKLLDVYDPEDLLKEYKKAARRTKTQKTEEQDTDD